MTSNKRTKAVIRAVAAAHGLAYAAARRLLTDQVGGDPVAASMYAEAPPRAVPPLDVPTLNMREWITPHRHGEAWGWACRCGENGSEATSSRSSWAARIHLREAHPGAWPAPVTADCRCGQGGLWTCSRRRMNSDRGWREVPVWVYACSACGSVALATTPDRMSAHLRYLGHPAAIPTEPVYAHHTRVPSPDWTDLLAWLPITQVTAPRAVPGHDPARCAGCGHTTDCSDCPRPAIRDLEAATWCAACELDAVGAEMRADPLTWGEAGEVAMWGDGA